MHDPQVLRAGLIGCGGISLTHIDSLKKLSIPVRAVCDPIPERAQAAAQATGALVCPDFASLLERPDVDVVHILTPHYLHAPIALKALEAGKHVVLEKPMATSCEDALSLIEHAKRAPGSLGIVFQNRYNASAQTALKIIKSREMGAPLGIRASLFWHRRPPYYFSTDWRGRKAFEGGGLLINQAIHTLDLLLHLMGPAGEVKGSVTTDLMQGEIEVEENAHAVLRFQSGATGVFFGTNSHLEDAPVEIEVLLEGGRLVFLGDTLRKVTPQGETVLFDGVSEAVAGKSYWGNGHLTYLQEFYASLLTGAPFPIDGPAGYPALELVLAIYQSSKTGKWQPLRGHTSGGTL